MFVFNLIKIICKKGTLVSNDPWYNLLRISRAPLGLATVELLCLSVRVSEPIQKPNSV